MVSDERTDAVRHLLDLLDVAPDGDDAFIGPSDGRMMRTHLFGGQVLAQALRSASATIEVAQYPNSLHAYFLRAGAPTDPVRFAVDRTRDGRGFSTRRVTASQDGRIIFVMMASFHQDEPGREFTLAARDIVRPDDGAARRLPIGLDVIDGDLPAAEPVGPHLFWGRAAGPLPDDRVVHACVAAYLSDLGTGTAAATAVGIDTGRTLPPGEPPSLQMGSLDHALWFHRPLRADDWLFVHTKPLSTAGSRGVIAGSMHDSAGRQVASFNQELLVREL